MKQRSQNPRKKQQRHSKLDQKSVLGHEIYQRAVEAVSNAMVMVDAKRKITFVNAKAEQLFGYRREELIGKEIESLVPERFRSQHLGHVQGFFQDTKARLLGVGRDLFGLKKDGTEIPIEIGLNPIKVPEGLFVLASIIDITERKKAEAALDSTLVQLEGQKKALDQFAIVVETDKKGKITYVNDQFCVTSKYSREELIGSDHRDVANSGYHSREFWQNFWATIQAGKIWRGDVCNKAKDGTIYWEDTSIVPFPGKDGKPEKYLAIRANITERKRAEEVLAEERKTIERVNLELDSFVYTASHDLRAPLRAMSSYAAFLEEDCKGQLDKKREEYLAQIRKGADRMSELIEDLLTLSRISRIQNPYEEVDTRDLLDFVLARIEFDLNEMKIDLRIQDGMPMVYCDRIKIAEVFLNLINNAIKFSFKTPHETPRLEIGWRDQDESCEFYVKDNGIGIDPQYHEKIFGIFEKLHLREEYEGTGIGLSIVKRIMQDHGGRVWVESGVGKGAAFYFTIPKDLRNKQKKKQGPGLGPKGGSYG